MRRREFVTVFGGAAVAWPLVARAQQVERVRHVGMLNGLGPDDRPKHGGQCLSKLFCS
jgi:putative ABC transport system substrate-binding protein